MIRFTATLDPNGNGAAFWPRYTNADPQLLVWSGTDANTTLSTELDTYREEPMAFLTKLSLADPI